MYDSKAIIIDIDDTVLNLGDRRYALFKKHFPMTDVNEEDIRKDVELSFLGDRQSIASQQFLNNFFDSEVIKDIPLSAISGSVDAIESLISQGLKIIFITGRHISLKSDTIESLSKIGIEPPEYELFMSQAEKPVDPIDVDSEQQYKKNLMFEVSSQYSVIAAVGDRLSDISAAVDAKIPAILLESTTYDNNTWNLLEGMNHVGLTKCKSWAEVLLAIGRLEVGNSQMEALRDSFTVQYSSWLQNLNSLAAIDVTIASILAAFASQAILNTSLHNYSRIAVILSLMLSLLSIIFAIRAFTSRYTSGSEANNSIIPKIKQIFFILFDTEKNKHKPGDAIDEYIQLKKASEFLQSRAHLDFYYKRYGTYNPGALMNLRLYEMRAVNYAKAYPEHISSSLLVWNIIYIVFWVIGVALCDPAISINIFNDSSVQLLPKG